MIEPRADSERFEQVLRDLLSQGLSVRFQARGASMSPAIRDQEYVEITPVIVTELRKDDIVLAKSNFGFRLHRIVTADFANGVFVTRGDCGQQDDPPLRSEQILGVARSKEVRVGNRLVKAKFHSISGWVWRGMARVQYLASKLARKSLSSSSHAGRKAASVLFLIALLFAGASLRAQVAVDSATSNSAEMTSLGTTLTIAHTTAGTNRLMLVGVSINLTHSTTAAVSGVTWNGTALTSLGAHNDTGNSRRVEMWYLLAPATGSYNVVVTMKNLTFPNSVGVVAGVTTFTGVDQTVPLGTFTSADGSTTGSYPANSQEDVPSVVNGMILDTLAISGNTTITVPGPQVQQWNVTSGNNANTDVRASGSTRTGAPSVPISETFGANSNWSLGAVSVNPSGADIGVTTSVSAVALGQNSTYNITITNNGPSAANGVTLTDTYATTGLSIVSVTPSGGTTCTTGATISCTLPTPFASGATATVAVTVSTTAAGFYPNTATVTDSGTPPDPNTGNNTYVALAPVVSVVCGATPYTAGGTLSGVVNTYYPGASSVSAGATSIPLGTANGTGTIAAGTELLVIQMQDASINTSNTVAYGNGYTGTGFTAINNAGNYEFVTATGPISGGSVPIFGAGVGGGLVFGYNASAATATKGQSTYQVVLVPQYSTATLGALTAAAWNGSTGGILAIDVAGQLNLGSATVSVNGLGFRGGAGMQLVGGYGGANTDYQYKSPTTYTGAAGGATGVDASKGEGVAGTPEWVESGGTFLQTTSGYPSGTAGTDGSMARGAPANAGAGGTDADPATNDQNAGGGGGGNGGSGGFGGDSWDTNLSDGGEGGSPFPATIDRLAMGGGGGAGTRNNSDTDNQASGGAAGGGIVFMRALSFTGTATITANGSNAYNLTANDAGGGGGAGGTIVMLSASGGESGLTLQANGGTGGNAWASQAYSLGNRHGPGGGGGGGVIYVSGTPAGSSVTGGADGLTLNPGVPYGSTYGSAGTVASTAKMSQVTGLQSSEVCSSLPDLGITKTHGVGNLTRGGTATYTLQISNVNTAASAGTVTMNDTLPVGVTPTAASGTGWTCSLSGQTVSCTRSDALAGGAAYPAITITASVAATAPSTITNSAVIFGGGDVSPLNDTGTDVATVVSNADMGVIAAGTPNPVTAGADITYTVTAANHGPSAADNATLVAAIPTNTTLVSIVAPSGWSCLSPGLGGTGNVVCSDSNLATGASGTLTMVVAVNSGVANGTVITQTDTVSSSALDPNSSNNTAIVSTVVGGTGPNLFVTNSASPNPVQAGNNITYTQVVTNTGSSAITNGTFTEATPANTTFVSITPPAGWTCTGFPVSPCTATSIAAGTSGTFTVVYTVNSGTTSGTTITDTATVNASNQSFGANSATATDVVASATQADVSLSTGDTPTVIAGNNITYTQTVTNNGPAAAAGVSLTEATPANTTFQSVVAPSGWTCTTPAVGATGNVVCTDGSNLPSTDSADIIIVLGVNASATVSSITAASSVASTTSDPNTSNNSTSVTTAITVACDLSVTDSGSPNPVTAGSNITYTQVVSNAGPSNCSTATFNETTPTNTTFVSITPPTGWTCTGFPTQCTDPSVAPGSGTFTVVYKVSASAAAGTIIADTVNVATTSHDTNTANNTASTNDSVVTSGTAFLVLTNSASPNPVNAGSNITYTQTLTNNGPAIAGGTVVALFDAVPAGTTFVSQTGPAGWSCGVYSAPYYTCSTASLGVNATATFAFVVNVSPAAVPGTTITQTDSTSSAPTGDSNPVNSANATTYVAGSADLSVTNTPNPVPVQAGNNIVYTQVVNNAGPSTATSVSLTDNLPANTTAVSISGPSGWTCTLGTLTCTDPSLAPSSPATITYTVTVNSGVASGTNISETANVTSAVSDPNTSNNTATASDVVATATQADLVVTNVASPTSVSAGSTVTYTQGVTNNGPAAATSPSFTENTPPNTTFQSISIPTGWTCPTLPSVGGTGTIICNDGSTLGSSSSASFTVVLNVSSSATSGTNITDTATATATNIVPGLTSNTASATVVVANANSADMAIVKTATPNPVTEGTPLTYSLAVTNNGPATATNVTVTDTLPASVTYLSANTTLGSCSEAGGTVTCLLTTMASSGSTSTATITILTLPNQAGTVSNTATVSADQTDPILTNNTSTQTETVTYPTKISLKSFSAQTGTDKNGAVRVAVLWSTSGEAHNLGFNVYRDMNGNLVRMNPSIIAGSALLMAGSLPKHASRNYAWIDPSAPVAGASYWLEDVDVNGIRTMHGPISVTSGTQSLSDATVTETKMLSQMNQAIPSTSDGQQSRTVEFTPQDAVPTPAQLQKQFALAARPAVKMYVRHEGWYRVTQPELVKAGLDPNVDPALLHLYAEAIELPIQITGATAGPGGFGPQAAINFYGTGINTVYSGTRVYWLVAEKDPGERILQVPASTGSNPAPANFLSTVELQQHTTYFAALITQDGQNFFGALVSSTPVDQTIVVPHLDTTSSQSPRFEIALQGIVTGFPHDVAVTLNGTPVGDVVYSGQSKGTLGVNLPPGLLLPGSNTVTLTSQNGEYDTSLVDFIRITYPHRFVADSDQLKFTGRPGDEIIVDGFSSAPVVLDITDPENPVELTPHVTSANGRYEIAVQVPFATASGTLQRHTLFAIANNHAASVAGVWPNHPSHWHSAQAGADIAMITYGEFAASLAPLVKAHARQGQSSAVVPIIDLYDEFNFGERTPAAIRDFLQSAQQNWKTPPTYLLLNGRASFDPRNYLGFGNLDLVPTMIVPTTSMMTASDDWFSDFSNTGMPTIATGRLPVSTIDEANTVIGKIATYEGQSTNGPWTSNALMVADMSDTENFTQDSLSVQSRLPASMQATDVFVDSLGYSAAAADIVTDINSGQGLVNYLGHGSEEQWSGSDIFDENTVATLTNGDQLPVFLIMNCLNGFFQDVYAESLSVSLMLAQNGGAVAVLASSGLNQPTPQVNLDSLVVHNALSGKGATLGGAILKSKSYIGDGDVRRTYNLLGDPAMQIKPPSTAK